MEKYTRYSAEQFIQDETFRSWVLSGDPESTRFWQVFLEKYPECAEPLQAAKALFLALHESQSVPTDEQGRRMWMKINESTLPDRSGGVAEGESPAQSTLRPLWTRFLVAALLLIFLGVGWVSFLQNKPDALPLAETEVPLTKRSNPADNPLNIQLSDGSRVVLYPESTLDFADPFGEGTRTVRLMGKGYFEVARDTTRPFVVLTGSLSAEVVGTSFTVDAFADDASPSVRVRTGKVRVSARGSASASERFGETVLLSANQETTFDPGTNTFATSTVPTEAPVRTRSRRANFNFQDVAVADVFKTLEQSYGVTIDYDESTLRNCAITAPLFDEPLFRKLDIVCQTIGATYEVFDTRIVVTGPGCLM